MSEFKVLVEIMRTRTADSLQEQQWEHKGSTNDHFFRTTVVEHWFLDVAIAVTIQDVALVFVHAVMPLALLASHVLVLSALLHSLGILVSSDTDWLQLLIFRNRIAVSVKSCGLGSQLWCCCSCTAEKHGDDASCLHCVNYKFTTYKQKRCKML